MLLVACEATKPAPRPAPGPQALQVAFDTDPPGAALAVDGYGVGLTPLKIPLDPGTHQLSLNLSGYLPYKMSVRIGTGSPTSYKASLIASH
jgi:hypothetical protein